ncbi:MAG: BlaI/MecI/CopY family transcriptional regulator [Candidatus Sericytochromatia bacterium]
MSKKNSPNSTDSTDSRRQSLLDFFHKHPAQVFLISDLKKALKINNEQNLRRDLEWLSKVQFIKKDKDKSELPTRSTFQLEANAPVELPPELESRKPGRPPKAAPSAETAVSEVDDTPKPERRKGGRPPKAAKTTTALAAAAPVVAKRRGRPAKNTAEAIPAAPKKKAGRPPKQIHAVTHSQPAEASGHRAARELEAQILDLVSKEALPAKEIAHRLKRQQPTVFKALERLQQHQQIERGKQGGRAYLYFPPGQQPAVASPEMSTVVSSSAKVSKKTALPNGLTGAFPPFFEEMFQTAVTAAVNAAVDRIMSSKR